MSPRFIPVILLMAVLFSFFYFDLHHYVKLETIKTYHLVLKEWTQQHQLLAVSLYLFIFTVLIACTIPCGTVLTLLGGFLFGIIAILYAMIGTTLGGLLLYLTIRTSIGASLKLKSGGWVKALKKGFQHNAFYYLLMLRLLPVCPCWICNISAGVLNVPLKTFLAATILGIAPSIVIYTLAGRSLDELFSTSNTPFLKVASNPAVFFPLLGLALLSLFPVIYKSVKKHRQKR